MGLLRHLCDGGPTANGESVSFWVLLEKVHHPPGTYPWSTSLNSFLGCRGDDRPPMCRQRKDNKRGVNWRERVRACVWRGGQQEGRAERRWQPPNVPVPSPGFAERRRPGLRTRRRRCKSTAGASTRRNRGAFLALTYANKYLGDFEDLANNSS